MNSVAILLSAALATIRNPRAAARQVMAVQMSRQNRWEVLLLVAILSTLLAFASMLITDFANVDAGEFPIVTGPIVLGASQLIVMVAMVYAIHYVGSWAGGIGALDDAILLVAWMQFILICLQVAQIIAVLVFPALALLLGLAGLVLVFVLLTMFVSELHGFKSVGGVFFAVLFVMLISATLLRFVFGLFGFDLIGVL